MKNIVLVLAHPALPLFLMALHDPQLHDWVDSAMADQLPITKEFLGHLRKPLVFGEVLREEEKEAGDDAGLSPEVLSEEYEGEAVRRLSAFHEAMGWGVGIGLQIAQIAIGVAVSIGIAFIYKTNVTDRRKPFNGATVGDWSLSQGRDFRYGIFDCFSDIQYCLHGWCCCNVRVADTYHGSGVGVYWTYIMAFVLFFVFYQLLSLAITAVTLATDVEDEVARFARLGFLMYYIAQIPFGIWLAQQRGKLREAFGGDSNGHCMMDFICYWWCGCCVAVQEARHFDGATNTSVTCCCNFEDRAPAGAVVGQPVGIVGGSI